MKKEEMLDIQSLDEVLLTLFDVPLDDKPIIIDHVRQELMKFSGTEDNMSIMSALTDIGIKRIAEKHKEKRGPKISEKEMAVGAAMASGFMFGYLYRVKEMHQL